MVAANVDGAPLIIDDITTLPDGTRVTLLSDGQVTVDPGFLAQRLGAAGSGAANTSLTYVLTYTLAGGETGTATFTVGGVDDKDLLQGTAGVDVIDAGLANDTVHGLAGADTLHGDDGNDGLFGGDDGDSLFGDLGADKLYGEDGWVLAANIEGLELQGSAAIDGTGNYEANKLQGNSGADTLSGLGGNDTINGDDGDDVAVGGLGGDLLRGGLGPDRFVVAHTFATGLETDIIYDFSAAEGDILDLSGAYGGTLSIVSAFTRTAGEMTVAFAGGQATVRLDINGDGKAEYQVRINGDVTGEVGDWLL